MGNTGGGFGGCFGGGQTGDLGNRPESWVTLRPGDVSHIWEPWAGLQRGKQGADEGQVYGIGGTLWTVGEVVGFPVASALVANLAPAATRAPSPCAGAWHSPSRRWARARRSSGAAAAPSGCFASRWRSPWPPAMCSPPGLGGSGWRRWLRSRGKVRLRRDLRARNGSNPFPGQLDRNP